jgi:hypothetical protein
VLRPYKGVPGRGGLWIGRDGWVEELEDAADALRPGGFVVFAAFYAFVVEVLALAPAFFEEDIAELFYVLDDTRALFRADIEPDRGPGLDRRGGGKTVNHALVPPDGRGESGDLAEQLRIFQAEI